MASTMYFILCGVLLVVIGINMLQGRRLHRNMLAAQARLEKTRIEYENRLAILWPILRQIPPGSTIVNVEVSGVEDAPDSGRKLH